MEVLTVENVSKKFGKLEVLKNINLKINKGEIVTLVGPNGSGKTTLMKAISDLMAIDSGRILLNGKSAKENREAYVKELSCIIEAPAFYEMLSGYQNLKLIANLNQATDAEVLEVLNFINIGKAIHRKVKGYSLGMKQRLALGMAIIQNPSLIILDEPTNGLDLTGVMEFRKLIRRLIEEKNVSILISTHIVSDIECLSDRLVFLKDGELHTLDSMQVDLNRRHALLTLEGDYPFEGENVEWVGENQVKVTLQKEEVKDFVESLVRQQIPYTDFQLLNQSFEEVYREFYEIKDGD